MVWGLLAIPRTKVREEGDGILHGLLITREGTYGLFIKVTVLQRWGINDASVSPPCAEAPWNDNISMQSDTFPQSEHIFRKWEIDTKFRGVTDRVWRPQAAILVQVLYLKDRNIFAPRGRWLPSAGHRSSIPAFPFFNLFITLRHLFPNAREHLCTDENCPQVRQNRQWEGCAYFILSRIIFFQNIKNSC